MSKKNKLIDLAELHRLPDEAFLTRNEAAAFLGLSISWLETHATDGKGIPFVKICHRKTLYKKADILAFIENHKQKNTNNN